MLRAWFGGCLAVFLGAACVASTPPGDGDKPPPGSKRPTAVPDEKPQPAETLDLRTRKTGQDWPYFLGPNHDSTSAEKGIRTSWPKDGLPVVWRTSLGLGYAPPAVAAGRLYHFDAFGKTARLSCRRAETGQLVWAFEYPFEYEDLFGYDNGPRCSPVVDEDRVYIHGVEGMLHCLRAIDGKLVWKVDTKAEFGVVQNFFGVGSAPLVMGDLLIVQVGGSPPGTREGLDDFPDRKGNGTGVVAFDKRTGQVRYKVTDELASYSSPRPATIAGRPWCFVWTRAALLGLEPSTGKVEFRFPWRARILESVNASNPVVVGDIVVITECYGPGAAALRVKPGGYEVLWTDADKGRDKSLACHWNTPIHVDGYLYGSSGRHTSQADLRCVELQTGRVVWRQPGLTRCSLLGVDGHFLCLSEDGILRLLKVNPKRYEELAQMELADWSYPCWAAPILSNGLLYVRGQKSLVCLELIPK